MNLPRPLYYFVPTLVLLSVCANPTSAEPSLHVFNTRHYRIHTDLDYQLASDTARRMDSMYEEYSRRLVIFNLPETERIQDVYLFQHKADYINFTGNRLPNSGGVFMPSKHTLAAFLEGQGRDGLRRTLQHEAFHQFAFSAISPNLPLWLNEGLAQLFEESLWTGNGFLLGQVPPRRIRKMQSDIDAHRLIPFATMLPMTHEDWQSRMRDPINGGTQYNQAWAMVHFLVHQKDSTGQFPLRTRLINMLQLIHNGTDPKDAFAQAYSNNLQGFQDRFVEFIRALSPTPEAQFVDNLDVLSDMLVGATAHAGRTFKDMVSFRATMIRGQYQMHYSRGEIQWTSSDDPSTYFRDPQGDFYPQDRLYLDQEAGSDTALPDLVFLCTPTFQLRSHFYQGPTRIEHEITVHR